MRIEEISSTAGISGTPGTLCIPGTIGTLDTSGTGYIAGTSGTADTAFVVEFIVVDLFSDTGFSETPFLTTAFFVSGFLLPLFLKLLFYALPSFPVLFSGVFFAVAFLPLSSSVVASSPLSCFCFSSYLNIQCHLLGKDRHQTCPPQFHPRIKILQSRFQHRSPSSFAIFQAFPCTSSCLGPTLLFLASSFQSFRPRRPQICLTTCLLISLFRSPSLL